MLHQTLRLFTGVAAHKVYIPGAGTPGEYVYLGVRGMRARHGGTAH